MAHLDALIDAASSWMQHDPDPDTRAATAAMIEARDEDALATYFGTRLSFGTAGLRGPIGPGPGGMNQALVRGVAFALGRWLGRGAVVIGYDGRHGSRRFAEESASILAGMGLAVWLFDTPCPTPELSFAVRHLEATAGVMVTASHNPPEDNGYKVYDHTGGQILPPEAEQIASAWEAQPHPPGGEPIEALKVSGAVQSVPEAVGEAWLEGLLALRVHPDAAQVPLQIVYTAMHGVGASRVLQLLGRAGHRTVTPVAEQCTPDPDFPTVRFPNPEEPGAMDLALAEARAVDADLVMANDPDADRLAVAIRDGKGGYHQLSGNEVGWLLADDLLASPRGAGPYLCATSIVSSSLLRRIAARRGVQYAETLTGFKWIGKVAEDFEDRGGTFVVGYEEALGYLAGGLTRDKDGVGAALLLADLAADCKRSGETLLDRVEQLHRTYGLHVGGSASIRLEGVDAMDRMAAAMDALRADPPTELADREVLVSRDLLTQTETNLRTGEVSTLDLPPSNVLAWDLQGGRALARPSGTEPKFKVYYEVVLPVPDGAPLAPLEAHAGPQLEAIRDALLKKAGLL